MIRVLTCLWMVLMPLLADAQFGFRSPVTVCNFKRMPTLDGFPSGSADYYALGEAAGNARVDSVSGFNLVEANGTVASASGKNGNCVDFRGPGSLDLLTNLVIDPSPTLSFVFWLYVDNLPVVDEADILRLGQGNGGLVLYLLPSGNLTYSGAIDSDQVSVALGALDTWHLVVGTWDGTTLKLSVDAGAFSSGAIYDATWENGLAIGAYSIFPTVDGLIDEFDIHERVLTITEVQTIFGPPALFGP